MKNIIIILTFIGILAIVVGYINQISKCPPPIVEYRYIRRTFDEEQDDPVKVSKIMRTMFEEPTPWVAGTRIGYTRPNIYKLNEYNITQSEN